MNQKKKTQKRIYKQGLMTGEERQKVNAEKREEKFAKKSRQNKKLKRDINGNPVW